MTIQHRELASGRWRTFSFAEQMAHVGSEIERAIAWEVKGKPDLSLRAFERALELLDLTIGSTEIPGRLRELLRVREALADHFVFDNSYKSTHEDWRRYFRFFLLCARGDR